MFVSHRHSRSRRHRYRSIATDDHYGATGDRGRAHRYSLHRRSIRKSKPRAAHRRRSLARANLPGVGKRRPRPIPGGIANRSAYPTAESVIRSVLIASACRSPDRSEKFALSRECCCASHQSEDDPKHAGDDRQRSRRENKPVATVLSDDPRPNSVDVLYTIEAFDNSAVETTAPIPGRAYAFVRLASGSHSTSTTHSPVVHHRPGEALFPSRRDGA